MKFVHPKTDKAKTSFLASSSLLENSSSADAKTISDALVAEVEDAGIDKLGSVQVFPLMECQ